MLLRSMRCSCCQTQAAVLGNECAESRDRTFALLFQLFSLVPVLLRMLFVVLVSRHRRSMRFSFGHDCVVAHINLATMLRRAHANFALAAPPAVSICPSAKADHATDVLMTIKPSA